MRKELATVAVLTLFSAISLSAQSVDEIVAKSLAARGGVDKIKAIQPLPEGVVKNMAGGADIDGPLLDYKAKGNKVELQGKEKVEGRDTYKLMVTTSDGQVRYEFLDCETYLGTKWQGKLAGGEKDFEVESYFHDYRKVDGVMFAFAIDSNTVGDSNKQKLVFDKVEVNVPLDDARFGKPK